MAWENIANVLFRNYGLEESVSLYDPVADLNKKMEGQDVTVAVTADKTKCGEAISRCGIFRPKIKSRYELIQNTEIGLPASR